MASRWLVWVMVCVGCTVISDPDRFERPLPPGAIDAGTVDTGEADAGADPLDAGGASDAGDGVDSGPMDPDVGGSCGVPPPVDPGTPVCCADSCEGAPGPPDQRCLGAACERGHFGVCLPRPMVGQCFVDSDCAGPTTCVGAPDCTCGDCPAMPVPGNCR